MPAQSTPIKDKPKPPSTDSKKQPVAEKEKPTKKAKK